jgi:hypothetical protein
MSHRLGDGIRQKAKRLREAGHGRKPGLQGAAFSPGSFFSC